LKVLNRNGVGWRVSNGDYATPYAYLPVPKINILIGIFGNFPPFGDFVTHNLMVKKG
jgi:hypothetical protein